MTSKGKNGEWRTTYQIGKCRREITLSGKMDERDVDEFERLARLLAVHQYDGVPISQRDQRRIEDLPEGQKKKLIAHGLLEISLQENVPTIQLLVNRYTTNRHNVKKLTVVSEKAALQDIVDYFKPHMKINSITPEEAEGFGTWLMKSRKRGCLAPATAHRRVGKAKTLFQKAVKWGYLTVSPFADVKVERSVNTDRQDCISLDRFMVVVNACPHHELRLILVLAYHGLRIPSEIRPLKFSDIEEVVVNDGRQFKVLMVADKRQGTKTGGRPVLLFLRFSLTSTSTTSTGLSSTGNSTLSPACLTQ